MAHNRPVAPSLLVLAAAVMFAVASSPAAAQGNSGPLHRIQGTVLGLSGQPLVGIQVRAFGTIGDAKYGPWADPATSPTGAFSIEVPSDRYVLRVSAHLAEGQCVLGYYGSDGEPGPYWGVPRVVVSGAGVTGIVIKIPAAISELCRSIQGVVTNANGAPLDNQDVRLHGQGDSEGAFASGVTEADGMFTLYIRDGTHAFLLATTAGTECVVTGYEPTDSAGQARITVDREDIDGLRITVTGDGNPTLLDFWCQFASPFQAPVEMVTSELQPGLNLVGWTQAEADAEAIFKALPQLEVVYAWDAREQRFRWAARGDYGLHEDLEMLTPGMGLWLYLGGEEPVLWSRPVLAEAAMSELREGWNLLAWGGDDRIAVEEAFEGRAEGFPAILGWDARQQRFLAFHPGLPTSAGALQDLARGSALWIWSNTETRWLQPGWPKPEVVFLGDLHPDSQRRFREQVDAVQAFYADRYGTITSDVTFYYASSHEALADTYRQVRGRPPVDGFCADSGSKAIFIQTSQCLPTAHEYFHAVQQNLSNRQYRKSPPWIVEGSAVYTDFQRRYSRGTASYEEGYHFIWSSLGIELNAETAATMRASIANSIGYLAMEWLADEAGEAAIIDYFGALKSAEDWETAFERAFGLSVGEFYSRLEAYRLEVASPLEWNIQGVILDHNAQPMEGVTVFPVKVFDGQPYSYLSGLTASDGSFSITDGPGSGFILLVRGPCASGAYFGAQGEDGFTTDWRNAPPFAGEDQDRTGIVITLPTAQEEFERDRCGS